MNIIHTLKRLIVIESDIKSGSERTQILFTLQNIFAVVYGILTGGVFLTGFAVLLGASDEVAGFITLLPSMAGIVNIFSGLIWEKIERRKKVIINILYIGKVLISAVVIIPFLLPKSVQIPTLMVMVFVGYSFLTICAVAINIWFMNLVPQDKRGRYFARRQSISLIIHLFLPIIAGRFIDNVSDKYTGFLIMNTIAMIFLIAENMTFSYIEEVEIKRTASKVLDIIRVPLSNRKFVIYTLYIFAFYVMLYISCAFSQVYMIKYLSLSYIFINVLSVVSAMLQIIFYNWWGRLGDSKGHEFVLNWSIWCFVAFLGSWVVINSKNVKYLMLLNTIFGAVANAGFAIGVFNVRYLMMPEEGKSFYEGFFGASVATALIVSPIIGGFIKRSLSVIDGLEFAEFRILYFISMVGMTILQLVYMFIDKKASIKHENVYN